MRLSAGKESLTSAIAADRGAIATGRFEYGVVARNESNRYFIVYNAKAGPALNDPAWKKTETSRFLDVDVVPALTSSGKVQATVLWKGQPVARPKSRP